MTRNPRLNVGMAWAFCLATVASVIAMGYSLALWWYDRHYPKGTP